MATFTSHVLDAISGTDARGVEVTLYRWDSAQARNLVFATKTDEGGRICQEISEAESRRGVSYELVFASGPYFEAMTPPAGGPIRPESVAVSFRLAPFEARYHLPMVISPGSATTACIGMPQ